VRASSYVANFDSATAMLRATARYLRGKDFPVLGVVPGPLVPAMGLVAAAANALPVRMRERVYARSGWNEAIPPEKLGRVRAEEVSRWMVREFPRRRYPAVAIGSSSGALIHLWCALGIPWLPQTFLIPVRHPGVPVDEPQVDMEWGKKHASKLLEANPELALHHMHDANQDRLMIQHMAYFRVKRLRLGETYERFLAEALPPGGTIFLPECRLSWPTTRVGERHVFQHGAPGGATKEEFVRGGELVEHFLARYGSHRRRWDSPEPDGERPEAEWGFEPALREDVERFARERGYRVQRLVFEEPEDTSPLVADLYRWWYRQRRMVANRLLIESFILMEPHWALRTGSVPFWMEFNMEPSLERVEDYLKSTEPYDEIHAMLFSHGVESVGLPQVERWRSLTRRARKRGGFVGVDEEEFPRDYATFVRYHTDLRRIPARYPMPGPLTLGQLDGFLQGAGDRYPVRWA
jgi:hypothetical protein